MTTAPLAAGSISLRMYPHALPGPERIAGMLAQAAVAENAGFDGVMTSEHHGGFPGYMPNPLQLAGWILEATRSLWAAPCPRLLPRKHWSHVAEDLAWLACRFPGRVGGGFAIGGLPQDFEMADLDYDDKLARFRDALPRVVDALRGRAEKPLSEDAAIAECTNSAVPVLSAAQSPGAVRRAARVGAGVLFDSLQTPERVRELVTVYRGEGGDGTACLIRRAWVGPPPQDAFDEQMRFYRGYAEQSAQKHWGGDELVSGERGADVAQRLADLVRASGCDAVNLRVHVSGLSPNETGEQIRRVGEETLPTLRTALAAS